MSIHHGTSAAPEDDQLGRAFDAALMARFWKYTRPYRKLMVLGLAITGALIGAELAGPLIVKGALDGPVTSGDARGLLGYSLLFGLALVVQGTLRYAENWVTSLVGQRIVLDLRQQVFAHLQRMSLSFYDRNPVGRLVTRVTNDVEALKELFTAGLVAAGADTFLLGAICVILLWIDWKLALVTLSMAPPLLFVAAVFRRFAREAYRDSRKALARLNAYLQENVSGMRVVQVFLRERKNAAEFRRMNADLRDAGLRTVRAFSLFFPLVELIGAGATAALLWYGGRRIGERTLTFGVFLVFWFYAQKFIQPIRDLSEKYNILQSAMAAAERIFKLLDTEPEVKSAPDARPAGTLAGAIEFRNVGFAYRPGEWVLRGVSFTVRAGESVALVGATGAGKTSLASLLFRFYDVREGQILVDGVDIREYDLASYRKNLGLVLQDVFLFSGDVATNLRLGKAGVSDAEVRRVAEEVHAHGVIERLPGGYAGEVKERGAGFSVGERQLLSFARALLFDPRILVLDEATSSIDAETEAKVQDALKRLLRGRTSLIIAHRLSTIREVDRILVFHHGALVEDGPHAELVKRGGVYARLCELQFVDTPPRRENGRLAGGGEPVPGAEAELRAAVEPGP